MFIYDDVKSNEGIKIFNKSADILRNAGALRVIQLIL